MITLFLLLIVFNLVLTAFMIFFEHKRPFRVVVWMLVFTIFPFIGFFLYLFLGLGITCKTKKLSKIKKNTTFAYNFSLKKQFSKLSELKKEQKNMQAVQLKKLNTILHNSLVLNNESIEIFRCGEVAFDEIKKSLKLAQKSIFISTYIFASDEIGGEIKKILLEKLKNGIEVFVLYDSFGSKKTKKSFFDEIKNCGGYVFEFFPSRWKTNLKINYRNHRKIMVIDGIICFLGGLNIRDDHLGRDKNFSNWIDTHLKIKGETGLALLNVIFEDIKLCENKVKISKKTARKQLFLQNYFQEFDKNRQKTVDTQIILSDPIDNTKSIEDSLIFLINNCKKEIIIETPYLILSDRFMQAIKLALIKGVRVKIFIPKLVDKKFVYNATIHYVHKLNMLGAEVFKVDGFLHSKTMLIDRKIFVCGSSNFDMRSFYLNFEVACVVFDKKICEKFYDFLLKSEKNSEKFTISSYKKLPALKKLAISFAKLFSPLL